MLQVVFKRFARPPIDYKNCYSYFMLFICLRAQPSNVSETILEVRRQHVRIRLHCKCVIAIVKTLDNVIIISFHRCLATH